MELLARPPATGPDLSGLGVQLIPAQPPEAERCPEIILDVPSTGTIRLAGEPGGDDTQRGSYPGKSYHAHADRLRCKYCFKNVSYSKQFAAILDLCSTY